MDHPPPPPPTRDPAADHSSLPGSAAFILERGGRRSTPHSAGHLRQLASSGKLSPEDVLYLVTASAPVRVGRAGDQRWLWMSGPQTSFSPATLHRAAPASITPTRTWFSFRLGMIFVVLLCGPILCAIPSLIRLSSVASESSRVTNDLRERQEACGAAQSRVDAEQRAHGSEAVRLAELKSRLNAINGQIAETESTIESDQKTIALRPDCIKLAERFRAEESVARNRLALGDGDREITKIQYISGDISKRRYQEVLQEIEASDAGLKEKQSSARALVSKFEEGIEAARVAELRLPELEAERPQVAARIAELEERVRPLTVAFSAQEAGAQRTAAAERAAMEAQQEWTSAIRWVVLSLVLGLALAIGGIVLFHRLGRALPAKVHPAE